MGTAENRNWFKNQFSCSHGNLACSTVTNMTPVEFPWIHIKTALQMFYWKSVQCLPPLPFDTPELSSARFHRSNFSSAAPVTSCAHSILIHQYPASVPRCWEDVVTTLWIRSVSLLRCTATSAPSPTEISAQTAKLMWDIWREKLLEAFIRCVLVKSNRVLHEK